MAYDASLNGFDKKDFLEEKRVFSLESSREHYTADAAIVWCFDDRFALALREFLKAKKLSHKDLICIAGGLKTLASPDNESDREFVLGQIRASVALHHTPMVYLMVHSDCGKYGGLAAFGGDQHTELEQYRIEAKKAEEYLTKNLPQDIRIESVFANFAGVYTLSQ